MNIEYPLQGGLLTLGANHLQLVVLVLDLGHDLIELLWVLIAHADEVSAVQQEFLQKHLTLCAPLLEYDVFAAAVLLDRLDAVDNSFDLLALEVEAVQELTLLEYLDYSHPVAIQHFNRQVSLVTSVAEHHHQPFRISLKNLLHLLCRTVL